MGASFWLIERDFGKAGLAFDENRHTFEAVKELIASGEIDNPLNVFSIDLKIGCCADQSAFVAKMIASQSRRERELICETARDFCRFHGFEPHNEEWSEQEWNLHFAMKQAAE